MQEKFGMVLQKGKIVIVINYKLDIFIYVIYKLNLYGYCYYL